MPSILLWSILCAVSYLFGSLNGALLVSKHIKHLDIREYGSGNAGMTNSIRVMGKRWTVIVAIVDLLKGVAAVLLGKWLAGYLPQEITAVDAVTLGGIVGGLCAILGHNFPVFFRFKGGKGALTAAAVVTAVYYPLILVCAALFFPLVFFTRYISLGSIIAAASLPVTAFVLQRGDWLLFFFCLFIAVMVIVLHRENMTRLLQGKENKFTGKRAPLQKRGEPHDKP
jgi:glycerol-3-phosphate acyltransferase PlsY